MSWRLLRSCAIILWLMSACMFIVAVSLGLSSLSYVVPVVLASSTSIAGYLFWRMANERQALMREATTALQNEGMPENLAEGLTTGTLTEDQYKALCDWASDEVAKREASWE